MKEDFIFVDWTVVRCCCIGRSSRWNTWQLNKTYMALLVSNKIRTESGARLFGIDGLPKRATVVSALVVCGERPSDV